MTLAFVFLIRELSLIPAPCTEWPVSGSCCSALSYTLPTERINASLAVQTSGNTLRGAS